jgi:hypothetical protein
MYAGLKPGMLLFGELANKPPIVVVREERGGTRSRPNAGGNTNSE